MAKRKSKSAKKGSKKAPSAAQLAARAAFSARAKGGKVAKKSKAKARVDRQSEPRTARSRTFNDDATSEYERSAVVPVEVPRPQSLPGSSPSAIAERKTGYGFAAMQPKPFVGKPKRVADQTTSFFI